MADKRNFKRNKTPLPGVKAPEIEDSRRTKSYLRIFNF